MKKCIVVLLLTLLFLLVSDAQRSNRRLLIGSASSAGCVVTTNAITITHVNSFGNTSNNNWYSSAAFTPAADSTLVVFGAFAPNATETFGDSVGTYTWWRVGGSPGGTNYNTIGTPTAKLTAWITQMPPGSTPGSMTISLTNTSGTGANLHVIQITGADTNLAWGTNAIVQSVLIASNATANPQITIAAPGGNGSNAVLLAFADDLNQAADNAAGNGQTELAETAFNTPATALATYFLTNAQSSQTLHTNIATSRDWASIALEIRAGTNNCGSGGASCPADGSPSQEFDTTSAQMLVNAFDSQFYTGQRAWSDASARTICKLGFKLSLDSGDISGKTYTCRIHTLTGLDLNAVVATSTGVAGNNGWANTWVMFTFPTPFTTTGGTSYAFTISSGATDGSNVAKMAYVATDTGLAGNGDQWTAAGVAQFGDSRDVALRVYWQ